MKKLPDTLAWRWPWLAKKAHVFNKESARSICGRWALTGPGRYFADGDEFGPKGQDDCAECYRRLTKIMEARHEQQ